MERIRAFIALNLPISPMEEIVALQRTLRDAAKAADVRVAWVPPPNLHITLKFLGEVPAESAYAVRDQLRGRLEGRQAWSLALAGVGVFPDENRPRVLWVGVEDDGQTAEIARDVDGWLGDLGFGNEKRAFHAHVTLGRIKEGNAPFWSGATDFAAGGCTPTEVVLYRSQLQRKGAEYHALDRFPLQQSQKPRTKNTSEEIAGHGSKPEQP